MHVVGEEGSERARKKQRQLSTCVLIEGWREKGREGWGLGVCVRKGRGQAKARAGGRELTCSVGYPRECYCRHP
eukprot:3741521-Rhodomonas_salina.1